MESILFDQSITSGDLIVIISVSLVVALGVGAFVWLNRLEKKRTDRIKVQSKLQPVPTESPVKGVKKFLRGRAVEEIRVRFVALRRLVFALIAFILLVIIAMPFLDKMKTAYVSFILGLFSIVIGVAARKYAEDFIAGLAISLGGRLKTGDTVTIDGHYGTIESIHATYCVLKVWNWDRYLIPNSEMFQKSFINHCYGDTYQWAHVEFTVAPDVDLEVVQDISQEVVGASPFFVNSEPPGFWVMGLGETGVRCWLAGWTNTPGDAWGLRNDINTNLTRRFHEAGIDFHSYRVRGDFRRAQKM